VIARQWAARKFWMKGKANKFLKKSARAAGGQFRNEKIEETIVMGNKTLVSDIYK
jgi:hypothetical protein